MKHASQFTFVGGKLIAPAVLSRVVLAAALGFSGTAIADNCKAISGTISALQPCGNGAPGCFQGTFSGDLSGTFQSSLTGLQITPPAVAFTATTAIQSKAPHGTVNTVDGGGGTGCTFFSTGQFICASSNEVLTITSGTGAFSQVYGVIVLSGGYMDGTGQGGTYIGQLCHGKAGHQR